jgi:hypothetical protein
MFPEPSWWIETLPASDGYLPFDYGGPPSPSLLVRFRIITLAVNSR